MRSQEQIFRPISFKEQSRLPSPVQEWIHEAKKERGVFAHEWEGHHYLLISLGMRPHMGYRIELNKVETSDHMATVFVEEKLPEPGIMYPQMVVYPYILGETYGKVVVWLIHADGSVTPMNEPVLKTERNDDSLPLV